MPNIVTGRNNTFFDLFLRDLTCEQPEPALFKSAQDSFILCHRDLLSVLIIHMAIPAENGNDPYSSMIGTIYADDAFCAVTQPIPAGINGLNDDQTPDKHRDLRSR